jgi:carboxyl-terminal processing protease
MAALVAAPLVAGGWMLQSRTTAGSGTPQLLEQVMGLVAQRFVDTVGAGALYERAARGLVKELNDPYSELFTPKQIAEFSRQTNGRYAGIGMEILKQGEFVTVARVFPNTPAEGAGVQEGDRIVQIDTQVTRGWTTTQVSNTLLGTPGTRVAVTFQRPGVTQPIKAEPDARDHPHPGGAVLARVRRHGGLRGGAAVQREHGRGDRAGRSRRSRPRGPRA